MIDDRKKELLMKVVDNLSSDEEKREFEKYLTGDRLLQDEFKAMKKVKEVTDSMKFKELPDSFWEGYWHNIYNRLERGLGWIFLSIGVIILLAFGGYMGLSALYLSSEVPVVIKIGISLGCLGLIILLVSLTREVLFARKKERYKEVEL